MFSGGLLGGLQDALDFATSMVEGAALYGGSAIQDVKTGFTKNGDSPSDEFRAKIRGTWDYYYECPKAPEAVTVEKVVDNILRLGNPDTSEVGFGIALDNILEIEDSEIEKAFQGIENFTNPTEKDGWIKISVKGEDPIWVTPSAASAFKKLAELISIVGDPTRMESFCSRIASKLSDNEKFPIETIEELARTLVGNRPVKNTPNPDPVNNNIPGGKSFGDVIKENLEDMITPLARSASV